MKRSCGILAAAFAFAVAAGILALDRPEAIAPKRFPVEWKSLTHGTLDARERRASGAESPPTDEERESTLRARSTTGEKPGVFRPLLPGTDVRLSTDWTATEQNEVSIAA